MQAQKSSSQPAVVEPVVVKEETPIHTLLLQIRDTLNLLDKAIINKQSRVVSKLTKNVRKYRNVIKAHHVLAIFEALSIDCKKEALQRTQGYNAGFTEKFDSNKNFAAKINKNLELEGFLKILVIQIWWRQHQYDECLLVVEELLGKIVSANRRSLDNYNSLLYYYYVRIHQKRGNDLEIRQKLLDAYNRACVRDDGVGQSTLMNLLLRNYLKHNHIDSAYNLIDKTSFRENISNNQFCKYLFYTGKVKAIRREYADALSRLNQAIRKSPDNAKGFKIHCQKIAIVVELLQGQIPNRQIFSDAVIFTNVYPYYKLIQVVLEGELSNFNKNVELYRATYEKDRLYTIILRLNQIVIRIGLRRISLAYSRISLADVAAKLNIPGEDIEFVVAKALRDGIINGEINHQTKILKIEGDQNIYVTNQPQIGLNKRIVYCLNLYHETQKAITYPDMKPNVEESKQEDLDPNELLNLLDFDDDM